MPSRVQGALRCRGPVGGPVGRQAAGLGYLMGSSPAHLPLAAVEYIRFPCTYTLRFELSEAYRGGSSTLVMEQYRVIIVRVVCVLCVYVSAWHTYCTYTPPCMPHGVSLPPLRQHCFVAARTDTSPLSGSIRLCLGGVPRSSPHPGEGGRACTGWARAT
jgi:hypothetical protein